MINTRISMPAAPLGRVALAVGAALALFAALPASSAHAATGTFFYHSAESGDLQMDHPDNDECRLLLQGATSASNQTNAIATIYFDRGCEEPRGTLRPGQSASFAGSIPRSVKFGS